MFYDSLKNNKLDNFDSVSKAALDCMKPYIDLLNSGKINSGSGATFNSKAINMEYVSRLLWGVISYLKGYNIKDGDIFESLIDNIWSGVDSMDSKFWGNPGNYDQIVVEMPAIALAIILKPEVFWDPLDKDKRLRIVKWFSIINSVEIPKCNWLQFPLIVNAALLQVAPEMADKALMKSCIDQMEAYYVGDGWYNDGDKNERRARDYYTPWAFYLLGLIFITVCPEFDPEYTKSLKEKTILFAKQYRLWFAPDGAGLPYGRSLSYHFAQSAFWGALVFADIEALPWGEIKGLWARNMRWWFKQDFFTETGIQQIGYTYPNMYMSERYNSPSSSLWAMQSFLPLSVGKDHPFWKAEELPLEQNKNIVVQEATGFFVNNTDKDEHVYAISNGQLSPGINNEHSHMAEKYEKFAYSNNFGFNVSTDVFGIDKLAPDNMLLIGKDGDYYRCRKGSTEHFISSEYSSSVWKPFNDVNITTYQIPINNWIIRVHYIKCESTIKTVEGGFPLPYDSRDFSLPMGGNSDRENCFYIETAFGGSGIYDFSLSRNSFGVNTSPNSNIQHPNTYIPVLNTELEPGEHIIVSAVMANPNKNKAKDLWEHKPDFQSFCHCLPENILAEIEKTRIKSQLH